MRSFHPSAPEHHLARRNEAAGSPSVLDQFNAWVSSFFAPSEPSAPSGPPPGPFEPMGPSTPNGRSVPAGSSPYKAILLEIETKYGKLPGVGYRDVVGDGNYVYRQYSDGRIFIQRSGRGMAPVPPKIIAATGGGAPPWVLPVAIVGGAALIGAGIYFWPKIRKKMGR